MTYRFAIRTDGECVSFAIAKKVLQQNKKQDTGGMVGVACGGRIDVSH